MSKALKKEGLERDLRTPVAPEPPEKLLIALKEDIPQDLGAATRPTTPAGMSLARRWQLAAATLFLAVAGIVIVDQVRHEVPLAGAEPGQPEQVAVTAEMATTAAEAPLSELESEAAGAASITGAEGPAAGETPAVIEAGKTLPDEELQRLRDEVSLSLRRLEEAGRPREDQDESGAASKEEDAGRRSLSSQPRRPNAEVPEATAKEQIDRNRQLAEKRKRQPAGPPASGNEAFRDEPRPLPVPPQPAAVSASPPPPSSRSRVERSKDDSRIAQSEREEGRLQEELQAIGYVGSTAPPSTGGTTEPNDQPYGDMFFESAGVNPSIDTEDDRFSTFGLDVDTGSYTMARSYLDRGHLPPRDSVRVEEFVNFFSYGDEPPQRGDFVLAAHGAPSPFGEGPRYQVLRFGVAGRVIDRAERKPAGLVFVIDVSGSMSREDRLGLVKRSLFLLLDQLDSGDRVGLVVYGSRGEVLLEPTSDHRAIRAAIERLRSGGSTNAEEGLVLGYELARRHFRENAVNRVVLCSDGVANVGRTGPDSILRQIEAAADEGIELTTVGFGMGNYNDVLMEQLADRGDGRYAYVDTLAEARRLFVDDLTGTLETIASDAKIQVEFNPETVSRYRLLGYENRDIADELFRDDTVDAGEIGAGHQVSAVYEIKLARDVRPRERLATLSLRYHSKAAGEVEEISLDLRGRDLARSWDGADPDLRLASLVAEFAEILRRSYWAREGDLGDVLRRAQELSPAFAGDAEVAELVSLVAKASRLSKDG